MKNNAILGILLAIICSVLSINSSYGQCPTPDYLYHQIVPGGSIYSWDAQDGVEIYHFRVVNNENDEPVFYTTTSFLEPFAYVSNNDILDYRIELASECNGQVHEFTSVPIIITLEEIVEEFNFFCDKLSVSNEFSLKLHGGVLTSNSSPCFCEKTKKVMDYINDYNTAILASSIVTSLSPPSPLTLRPSDYQPFSALAEHAEYFHQADSYGQLHAYYDENCSRKGEQNGRSVGTKGFTTTLSLYPNPIKIGEPITILSTSTSVVDVYDVSGRKMSSTNMVEGKNQISTDSMTKGIYIFRYLQDDILITEKVVVE